MKTAQWYHKCLNSGSLETSLNEIMTHNSFVKVKSHLATSAFEFPDSRHLNVEKIKINNNQSMLFMKKFRLTARVVDDASRL